MKETTSNRTHTVRVSAIIVRSLCSSFAFHTLCYPKLFNPPPFIPLGGGQRSRSLCASCRMKRSTGPCCPVIWPAHTWSSARYSRPPLSLTLSVPSRLGRVIADRRASSQRSSRVLGARAQNSSAGTAGADSGGNLMSRPRDAFLPSELGPSKKNNKHNTLKTSLKSHYLTGFDPQEATPFQPTDTHNLTGMSPLGRTSAHPYAFHVQSS